MAKTTKPKTVNPIKTATDALVTAIRSKDALQIDAAFENLKRVVNP